MVELALFIVSTIIVVIAAGAAIISALCLLGLLTNGITSMITSIRHNSEQVVTAISGVAILTAIVLAYLN